jgi:hypothetical protein
MPVRRIKELYHTLGGEMFRKPIFPRRFWYRYRADALSATLREVFGEATLGDARLRTLLMMVLRNETTDSPLAALERDRREIQRPQPAGLQSRPAALAARPRQASIRSCSSASAPVTIRTPTRT